MWHATQEFRTAEAKVRFNGRFAAGSRENIVEALMEWSWDLVMDSIARRCRNQAAVACLDRDEDSVNRWLSRAKAIEGIK